MGTAPLSGGCGATPAAASGATDDRVTTSRSRTTFRISFLLLGSDTPTTNGRSVELAERAATLRNHASAVHPVRAEPGRGSGRNARSRGLAAAARDLGARAEAARAVASPARLSGDLRRRLARRAGG